MSELRLETHEHSYPSGQLGRRLNHSHECGNDPHEHPETGPASYQIDRDEWYAATGLRGGGRKKFTAKPTGPQVEFIARDPLHVTVVFCDNYSAEHERAGIDRAEYEAAAAEFRVAAAGGTVPAMELDGPGAGGAALARMALSFEPIEITYLYEDRRDPGAKQA